MRRISIAVLAASAMAVSCLAGSAQASEARPGGPDISGEVTICLTSASSSCMDIKNSVRASGSPLWIFSKSQGDSIDFTLIQSTSNVCDGEASCGGNFSPFTVHSFDSMYQGDEIEIIAVHDHTNLCVGESSGSVILRSAECAVDLNTFWVVHGDQLINVANTDSNDLTNVLTATGTADRSTIELDPPGDFGTFQRWTQAGV